MLQRIIAALLGVLGVAAVGLGIASATAWRADDPLVATAAPGGYTRTLVTDPGVLELIGDPVTVTVRADGAPVVVAIGRDTDVRGWIGTDPYVRVTGLADWHTLATTVSTPDATPSASATPTPTPTPATGTDEGSEPVRAADPTGSDLWVVEVGGDGSASVAWPAQDGRWSLIATSLGDTAPTLELSWPQTVTTPWLWPGVTLGVLLLAVAAVLLVRLIRSRDGGAAAWHDVSTGQLATVPGRTPSTGDAAAPPTGEHPVVGTPQVEDPHRKAPPTDASPTDTSRTDPPLAGTPTGAIPGSTPAPDGAPVTRRQIREAEAAVAAAAATERRRSRRPASGAVPMVTGPVTSPTPVVAPEAEATPTPTSASVPGSPPDPDPAPAPGAPSAPTAPADPAWAPIPAPVPTPSVPPASAPGEPEHGGRRGLRDRLPWRRSRAEQPSGPESPSTPPNADSWPRVPGTTSTTAPQSLHPTSDSDTGRGPRLSGPAAPAPGVSGPPGGPAAPGGTDPADDSVSRAQRADAWRRMWGFPSDESDGTGPDDTIGPPQHDAQGTEEGR